jgi:5'-nucleotidase
MRKLLSLALFILLFTPLYGAEHRPKGHHLYIISTNDMHANIDDMPRLATLVKEYETRGEVLIVDSGDRVTGNAYVDDDAKPGVPMIELMNHIGYDIVTLGNHEFDKGREALNTMIKTSKFDWVCSNVKVLRGMKQIKPYKIVRYKGARIGFVGVVTTDMNGRPAGSEASYVDFSFTTDYERAYEVCEMVDNRSDFVVLLSHMGLEADEHLAKWDVECDWIAGGHSHSVINDEVMDVHISQNRKDLRYVTIADVWVYHGDVESVTYEQVELKNYDKDPSVETIVEGIKARDPELNTVEMRLCEHATQDGVANFTNEALATYPYDDGFVPEVCFYHFGGVRLSHIDAGDVKRVTLLNNDPFVSTIYIGEMTPAQMRRFIIDKYNSGTKAQPDKESHYAYFRSTVPYEIVLDRENIDTPSGLIDAVDVIFPTLEEGRTYRVAMCNYIAENYIDKSLVKEQLVKIEVTVREAMLRLARDYGMEGYTPDNNLYQVER